MSVSPGSISVSFTGLCTEVDLTEVPVISRRFPLPPDPQYSTEG